MDGEFLVEHNWGRWRHHSLHRANPVVLVRACKNRDCNTLQYWDPNKDEIYDEPPKLTMTGKQIAEQQGMPGPSWRSWVSC